MKNIVVVDTTRFYCKARANMEFMRLSAGAVVHQEISVASLHLACGVRGGVCRHGAAAGPEEHDGRLEMQDVLKERSVMYSYESGGSPLNMVAGKNRQSASLYTRKEWAERRRRLFCVSFSGERYGRRTGFSSVACLKR